MAEIEDPARSAARTHRHLVAVTAVAAAALLCGLITPASASGAGRETDSVALGDFGLGDGLEATIDERVGSLGFTLSVAGLELGWDSRGVGTDHEGLGPGWTWRLTRVGTKGGLQVHPTSGGVFDADETHPSGLAGYAIEDVVFEQVPGTLPPRIVEPATGDGSTTAPTVGEADYAYALHQLGGSVISFNPDGDPVATTDRFGARTDWLWSELVPHRLAGVIDVDGVTTIADWDSEPGALLITRGTNLGIDASDEPTTTPTWRVGLDGGRISDVTDPVGSHLRIEYEPDGSGLVSRISGASGGTTELSWGPRGDGIARVSRVRTVDAHGAQASVREWTPRGDALASGWPHYAGEGDVFWSGDPAFRYETETTDGATRVRSTYNSLHTLIGRRLIVTTASGERTVQEQSFTYPGGEDGGTADPAALPGNWSRPILSEVHHRDAVGGSRTVVESHGYDDRGRLLTTTSADGTTTTQEYDDAVPAGSRLPIGLTIAQLSTGHDGRVQTVRHELNEERTAAVASETTVLVPGAGDEPVTTARSEYEVSATGLVTEQREYPHGDGSAPPIVTRWSETLRLAQGSRTIIKTVAVGTGAETSTSETRSLLHHGILETVDPVGNASRERYDVAGRVVAKQDGAGRRTLTVYESAQADGRNAATITGPDGVAVTELRDVLGRVTQITDNVDRGVASPGHVRVVETRTYPEPGTTEVTDAWGATTTTRQDVFGRPLETVLPSGLVELTVHDDVAGTVSTALTPTGSLRDAELVSTRVLDEAGRPIEASELRADGGPSPMTRTEYDSAGHITATSTDVLHTRTDLHANGDAVAVEFTPMGASAITSPTGPSALRANRRFDGFGTSVEQVLSDGIDERSGGSRTIDALGRTLTETDQLGRVTAYTYTADGLVATVAAGSGQLTEHAYDPATRTVSSTTITSPIGETVRTGYRYDPVTDALIATFDPDDVDATIVRHTHDALGNPTSVTYPDGGAITHTYDTHGRRISTTDIAHNTTTLEHDAAGRLVRATQRAHGGEPTAGVVYVYDAFDRVSQLERANGVRTEYTFTSASEIATEVTLDPAGRELSSLDYGYDAHGNVTRRTDTAVDIDGDRRTTTTEYAYDAYDRLVRSAEYESDTATGPARTETAYELSISGDVVRETVTEADRVNVRDFEYSELGELQEIVHSSRRGDHAEPTRTATQRWDAAGNLIRTSAGTQLIYDAANRPVSEETSDGTIIATEYWAHGPRRRVTETSPDADGATTAVTTSFYWDDATLINDSYDGRDDERSGVAAYLIGGTRHARTTTDSNERTTVRYYDSDRHGSVTALTDLDGRLTATYRYSDYGVPRESPGGSGLIRNPFMYAGELTDENGCQYLRSRVYEPGTMRFTTIDTAELHNLYAYADANPIVKVDPTGRAAMDDLEHWGTAALTIAMAVGGAIVAAVMGPAAIGPLLAIFAATFFDTAVTLATTVNDHHTRFLPDSVAVTLGIATIAAALLTAKFMNSAKAAATGVKALELQDVAAREYDALLENFITLGKMVEVKALSLNANSSVKDAWDIGMAAVHAARVIHHHRISTGALVGRGGLWNMLEAGRSNGIALDRDVTLRIRMYLYTTESGMEVESFHLTADRVLLRAQRQIAEAPMTGITSAELDLEMSDRAVLFKALETKRQETALRDSTRYVVEVLARFG